MDAGGRAAPAPSGFAAFTTSLWIATQDAKAEGPGRGQKIVAAPPLYAYYLKTRHNPLPRVPHACFSPLTGE